MGIPLPSGTMEEATKILATNDYMDWRKCTAKEAQTCANDGTAAMAVKGNEIYIVKAEPDGKDEVATVHSAGDTVSIPSQLADQEDVQFYSYSAATTGGGTTTPNWNIHFNESSMTQKVGWSGYSLIPEDCSITMVNWTSSDPSVASIDYHSGYITAYQIGTTPIKATTTDGYSAKYQLNIERIHKNVQTSKKVDAVGSHDAGFNLISRIAGLTIYYEITAIQGSQVKIAKISALAEIPIGNPIESISSPTIVVNDIMLNGQMLTTERDYDYWMPDDCNWYARKAVLNQWVALGSTIRADATANLHAIPGDSAIHL